MTRRTGYTLVEVLVAMMIFLILMVPLGWMTIQSANGKARARRIDDAVALAREDWGTVRSTPVKLLRDTTLDRSVGEHAYTLVRVVDTVRSDTSNLATVAAVGQAAATRHGPSVRSCVVSRDASDPGDTIRCFGWRLPLVEMQR